MHTKIRIGHLSSVHYMILIISLIFYCAYLYFTSHRFLIGNTLVHAPENHMEFKLKQIHRYCNDDHYNIHQVLDVTNEFKIEANDYYQELVNGGESRGDLWTTSSHYKHINPWDVKLKLRSKPIYMTRLVNADVDFVKSYLDFTFEMPDLASKVNLEWSDELVLAPNVSDKETILSLALMSSNAYVKLPYTGDWRNISGWKHSDGRIDKNIHWNNNGVRGHVFINEKEDLVVIALKGTSAQILSGPGDDDVVESDKLNDNLLFSCCCARISYLWNTVCDCYVKSYTCDDVCLEKELKRKDRYYHMALNIYKEVQKEYPEATIWITGHSLGGALASLVGHTFALPAVCFEAPGELLAIKRLNLPTPPNSQLNTEGIWHFGHTADPIFMGTCNGASSSCSIAGYAMETVCHSGNICLYDVVTDKGWHVHMLNHRIHVVIDDIIIAYDNVATCKKAEPCHDCYNWNYTHINSETITKSKDFTTITKTTHTTTLEITSTYTTSDKVCLGRNWLGFCTRYGI